MNNECEELFLNPSRAQLQLIILHFKNLLVFTALVYGWEIAISFLFCITVLILVEVVVLKNADFCLLSHFIETNTFLRSTPRELRIPVTGLCKRKKQRKKNKTSEVLNTEFHCSPVGFGGGFLTHTTTTVPILYCPSH